jgi:hypothetical protein
MENNIAQSLAGQSVSTPIEIKTETDEDRRLRLHQVRLENRDRKKRWREANSDRSIPSQKNHLIIDKDNDLRCRVNKRANTIYGSHSSPEKLAFIESEFEKRRGKRKALPMSPSTDPDSTDNMYAAILNNPEFANILMNLLAQKGVDPGDTETSGQLLELLKSNPDFLKGFLTNTPEETVVAQPVKADVTEAQPTAFHSLDPQLSVIAPALKVETLSTETLFAENTSPVIAPTTPRPALKPHPRIKIDGKSESVIPRPSPVPVANNPMPAMPAYIRPTTPASIQPPAAHDRVRALGFPPMMSHSRQ